MDGGTALPSGAVRARSALVDHSCRGHLSKPPLRAFASQQDRSTRSLANLSQNAPTTIPQAPPNLGICGQCDSYN
eukprot:scaffold7213_cov118-Isochrysis_galbana.AAC.3